jgi:hypothetical protein
MVEATISPTLTGSVDEGEIARLAGVVCRRCLNAVLAAAAYNFHLLLKWMELLLSRFLTPRKAIAALHRV